MIKIVSLFRRRPGMAVEAFQEYWATTHADIVRRIPGLRRYVQSRTLLSSYKKREPAVDGVAELWFDDGEALRSLVDCDEVVAALADHPLFIDMVSRLEIITEDVVIKEGDVSARGVKNIELVRRRRDIASEEFHRHWMETHGPLGAAIPHLRRYVQSHTLGCAYRDGAEPDLDGVALGWFDDTKAMRAVAGTEQYDAMRADEANFVDAPLDFVITKEQVIVG